MPRMDNRRWIPTLALAAALATAASAGLAAQSGKGSGRAYRWVDENGVTHYGDVVPPEYARQGRAELNSQGVPVREFPAQLSEHEAAEAQKAAAEAARRRQHDQFLLNTYTRPADIEQLRDERIALIDGQVALARGSIESLDTRLAQLAERMRNFQPYSDAPNARRLPDRLAEEIVRTLHERRSLQESLAAREAEKRELRSRFDADLARYNEITAGRAPR